LGWNCKAVGGEEEANDVDENDEDTIFKDFGAASPMAGPGTLGRAASVENR
jgi:hypothetical protein